MIDYSNDLGFDLVRERLLDARRERLAAEEQPHLIGRFSPLFLRLADRLGDRLISWGTQLKHHEPDTELARGWVWMDHK